MKPAASALCILSLLTSLAACDGGSDGSIAGGGNGGETGAVSGASSAGAAAGNGGFPVGGGGTTSAGAAAGNGGFPVGGGGPSTSAARFTPHPLGKDNPAPNGYYEYLPPDYEPSKPAPLLVFWHGIGQDGDGSTQLDLVPKEGLPKLIKEDKWPDSRPFIVLSPQYTPVNGNIEPGGGCPSSAVIDAFLTWALGAYSVDPKRVYLTGLSCGAIGSWAYLAQHRASVVTAAVLIAGNPGAPTDAGSAWRVAGCALRDVAIWSLHGDQDGTVPYGPDHDTVENLNGCASGRPALFTNIKGAGHDIWGGIYDLTTAPGDIYAWMLANSKP